MNRNNSTNNFALVTWLSAIWLVAGCAMRPDAPVVDAARPGAKPKSDLPSVEQLKAKGVVYHFQPGDRIELYAQATGDIVEGRATQPLEIIVKRELYFYSGPTGMLISEDGRNYRTLADYLRGSISLSLGIDGNGAKNRAQLQMIATKRE